ncbi:uncharacterized protein LOC143234098 [Tachypleus tridentatus]|uniref:uncharacterized protein LOC143234098 n=1 Tax=Tachypleus tridentatus TaxID=6853 RepID=UPI003FD37105
MTVTCQFPFLIGCLIIATVGLPVEKKPTTLLDLEDVPSIPSFETTVRYVADKFQKNQGIFDGTTPSLDETSSKDNSTHSKQPTDTHIDELITEVFSRMNNSAIATTESEKEPDDVTKTVALEEMDNGVADTTEAIVESTSSKEVLCTESHKITNESSVKGMSSGSPLVTTRSIDLQIVSAQDFVLKKLSTEASKVEEFYVLKKTKNTNISHDIAFEVALNVTEVDDQLLKDTQLNVEKYAQNVVTFNRTNSTVQLPETDEITQNTADVTSIKTIDSKENTSWKNISSVNQSVDTIGWKNISETEDGPLNISTLNSKGGLISINTNVDSSQTKDNLINTTGINDVLKSEYNLKNTVIEMDVLDPDGNPFEMLNATERHIWGLEKDSFIWVSRNNLSDVKENASEVNDDKHATISEKYPSHMITENKVANSEKSSPVMVSENNILIHKDNLSDVISEENISVLKNNIHDISFENTTSDLGENPFDVDMENDILNSTVSPPGTTKGKRSDELIKEINTTEFREKNQNITGNIDVSSEMDVY